MKQLETLSIVAPGFFGLNTQESGVTLSPNFAQLTDNVVIDKYGRLGARKGWVMQTTDGATALAGNVVRFMLEHVAADDSLEVLSAGNGKVFSGGIGEVLTDITPGGYTISDNDWSGANLNDTSIITQSGHEPLVFTTDTGATAPLQTLSAYMSNEKGVTATPNFGTAYPHGVIAAWGRYWAFTKNAVYWSTDIADSSFPAFSGGSSGSLNIAAVLPDNADDIEAVAAHNNLLIIFCKHNIVIYSGADNPISTTFGLQDIIVGVGCTAHKSVQNTGNDLIFLSDTGIRSLGRLIQEKSLPMRDLTKNVRDDFLTDVKAELANYDSLDHVASVYSEINAFYLISFPSTGIVYCLDMRSPMEDGSARVTVWYQYEAHSFLRLRNRDILIGKVNGIGKYSGYSDNGSKYRLRYFSHYVDFNTPTTTKILKQIGVTVLGGSNQQFTIKVGTDYSAAYRSYPFIVQVGNVFEYGVSEYTVAEFSKGIVLDKIKSSVGGSGSSLQIGFEADVNGSELSVQKIDAFIKTGRTG
jgi:hypothetical protein